jgi:uncharacterized membrane protein YfcA
VPPSGELIVSQWITFAIIGLFGGVASGLFGVGGGIVIVPALIYWAGFTPKQTYNLTRIPSTTENILLAYILVSEYYASI